MQHPTALVTGGSSGIGRGISRRLAEKGWHVVTCGRDASRLEETCHGLTDSCVAEAWDLAETATISSHARRICTEHGPFLAFIHCAGLHRLSPLVFLDDDDVVDLMNVNVVAPILVLRELLKAKALRNDGRVVLLGSAAARKGVAGAAAYAASKSAVSGFARSMAVELSSQRITVNCVEPGIVNTPLTEKMLSRMPETAQTSLLADHPLGFGAVNDVVNVCEFLLSPESRWITGSDLSVDGGYSIH